MDSAGSKKLPLFCTVGEFIGEFQNLENDLVRWIALLQNPQTYDARAKELEQNVRAAYKNFKDKYDRLEEITKLHITDNTEEKAKWQLLLVRIDEMRHSRNFVAHASHKIEMSAVVNDGKSVSEEEIIDLRHDVQRIRRELRILVHRMNERLADGGS